VRTDRTVARKLVRGALRDIRAERIIKIHAQMFALVDALAVVVPITKEPILATRETPIQLAPGWQARNQCRGYQ
jgi:hypothetical protein